MMDSGVTWTKANSVAHTPGQMLLAYEQLTGSSKKLGVFRAAFTRETNGELSAKGPQRAVPVSKNLFTLAAPLSELELQKARGRIQQAFAENEGAPRSILMYLHEAYYFLPIQIALQLQKKRYYLEALDWFRTVYDYSLPEDKREIYGLEPKKDEPDYERAADWLRDPLNPHAIAATRWGPYTWFTLLSLIRCILDYADDKFTRDTTETLAKARTLYLTALELLESDILKQQHGKCKDLIGYIEVALEDNLDFYKVILKDLTKLSLDQLHLVVKTVDDLKNDNSVDKDEKPFRLAAVVDKLKIPAPAVTFADKLELKAVSSVKTASLLSDPEVFGMARAVASSASADFVQNFQPISGITISGLAPITVEPPTSSLAIKARASGGNGRSTADNNLGLTTGKTVKINPEASLPKFTIEELEPQTPSPFGTFQGNNGATGSGYLPSAALQFCIPPNPIIEALRLRAEWNLYKLRNCLNIAGMKRELAPYAAPTDTFSGMPVISDSGQITMPGLFSLPPTLYRFPVLIERAKHLVQLAAQVEAAMLAALEKYEAETFSLLNARQGMEMARANIRLQDLRIREANSGVRLAELQQERAQIQVDHFGGLLAQDQLDKEKQALELLGHVVRLQHAASAFSYMAAALHQAAAGLSGWKFWQEESTASYQAQMFSALSSGLSSTASALSTQVQILQIEASFERQKQDWEFQKALGEQDVRIAEQQTKIAEEHVEGRHGHHRRQRDD